MYHGVVLTLSAKYIGLALMVCFIVMIYSKLYCFDKFMKEHHKLAEQYKKDPDTIQDRYNKEINLKIEQVKVTLNNIENKERKEGEGEAGSTKSDKELMEMY